MIRPSINCVAVTYDLAQDPQYEDLMTATSNLTGKKINRFGNIHQSTEDLKKKVKMQRLCGQKTASCFQRCVGMDAFNAEYSTTYEIDKKYGTDYHERFKKFLEFVQENDLVVDGAMTDPKGNRGLAPHAQVDPDMFVRIKEVRADGIVVRGADVYKRQAVERARKGEGPTLIECKTYRWQGHHVGDPATYRKRRSETEKEDWMKKDPIPALKEAVLKAGIASEEDFDKLDRLVEDEIQAAVQFAVDSEYPPAEDAYTDVFQQGTL